MVMGTKRWRWWSVVHRLLVSVCCMHAWIHGYVRQPHSSFRHFLMYHPLLAIMFELTDCIKHRSTFYHSIALRA
ncbi:uncharacterized protein J3D65DRAFT_611592 [Phyllosticta citribraziliensis]|uniref:Secreted protein n=1 Tax=Phyllosticta citribraziliensis TaxID=989973 RepID=A0ABR1MAZ5_9PEZI